MTHSRPDKGGQGTEGGRRLGSRPLNPQVMEAQRSQCRLLSWAKLCHFPMGLGTLRNISLRNGDDDTFLPVVVSTK